MGNKLDKLEQDLPPLQPGDEGYVDPIALEKQLVAEEQARLNKPADPEEVACMMLKLYTPRFNKLVDKLSVRGLRRVTKALVEFPLGKDYKHRAGIEAEAFAVGQGLMDAKMVLVVKTYHENKDQIEALAAEASKNSVLEFGNNEEQNEEGKDNG